MDFKLFDNDSVRSIKLFFKRISVFNFKTTGIIKKKIKNKNISIDAFELRIKILLFKKPKTVVHSLENNRPFFCLPDWTEETKKRGVNDGHQE